MLRRLNDNAMARMQGAKRVPKNTWHVIRINLAQVLEKCLNMLREYLN